MIRQLLGGAILSTAIALAAPVAVAAHPSVDVVASNWKFTPAVIEAHVGRETTLHISSSEGVHGVISPELGIHKTILLPDKVEEVAFTPTKPGTYQVHCAVMCGPGHDDMVLTVKVLP